jgi:disulfide oxidoreductase YuzD
MSNTQTAQDTVIAVYLLREKQQDADLLRLKFINSIFRVEYLDYNSSDEANDHTYVKQALTKAYSSFPNNHVIVIKDSSVTNATSELIADFCNTAIKIGGWDLLYLCKWLDRCDQYEKDPDMAQLEGHQSTYHRTYSPFGVQALMFTPSARDMILGLKNMHNGKKFEMIRPTLDKQLNYDIDQLSFIATSITPNMFEFNPMRARSKDDYKKLTHCREGDVSSLALAQSVLMTNRPADESCHRGHGKKDENCHDYWVILAVVILILFIIIVGCSCRRRY